MKDVLKDIFKNRKTYLAVAGLVGLAVYQASQGDYLAAAATLGGALTMAKNKASEPAPLRLYRSDS